MVPETALSWKFLHPMKPFPSWNLKQSNRLCWITGSGPQTYQPLMEINWIFTVGLHVLPFWVATRVQERLGPKNRWTSAILNFPCQRGLTSFCQCIFPYDFSSPFSLCTLKLKQVIEGKVKMWFYIFFLRK